MVRSLPNDDETAAEVKLIDFGVSYVLHPAYDVIYFLYTCTERSFRQLHYDALLRRYFQGAQVGSKSEAAGIAGNLYWAEIVTTKQPDSLPGLPGSKYWE